MNFHEFGDPRNPAVMLIHGAGNAWWSFLRQARALEGRFRVILPTLDGHAEECGEEYVSTEDEAHKLLEYVEARCGGELFLLGGVSLGGQIVMEMLGQRPDVARRAIVDGALCIPQPAMAKACSACATLLWPLMFGRAACRLQMWALRTFFPDEMQFPPELERRYVEDVPRLSRRALRTMYRTYMGSYQLKDAVGASGADIEFWYGEREMRCVKESARLLASKAPRCRVREAKGCSHGTLAVYRPEEWLSFASDMFDLEDANESGSLNPNDVLMRFPVTGCPCCSHLL